MDTGIKRILQRKKYKLPKYIIYIVDIGVFIPRSGVDFSEN
jgi:hypothetical protein